MTFLWHYLQARNIEFHIELIRNNPMYVRDSLVMANYEQKEYLTRIIADAILEIKHAHESVKAILKIKRPIELQSRIMTHSKQSILLKSR